MAGRAIKTAIRLASCSVSRRWSRVLVYKSEDTKLGRPRLCSGRLRPDLLFKNFESEIEIGISLDLLHFYLDLLNLFLSSILY